MIQPTGNRDPDETHEAVQRGRARQYTLCAIALQHDRLSVGAEGVFDQALTNGLAAVVAHTWPSKEADRKGRVLSADSLLTVIENHGTAAEDGVMWVPHDPEGPLYDEPFYEEPHEATEDQVQPFDDEPGEWWLKQSWDGPIFAAHHHRLPTSPR
ncbi:hypothetical protein [Actinomadura rugatobispora]|uniref:Uncharacterized protein n=1 Tax=Actinomadura rugatobispora TaxID=1994 RepID=A0ABW1A1A4_9ACTN